MTSKRKTSSNQHKKSPKRKKQKTHNDSPLYIENNVFKDIIIIPHINLFKTWRTWKLVSLYFNGEINKWLIAKKKLIHDLWIERFKHSKNGSCTKSLATIAPQVSLGYGFNFDKQYMTSQTQQLITHAVLCEQKTAIIHLLKGVKLLCPNDYNKVFNRAMNISVKYFKYNILEELFTNKLIDQPNGGGLTINNLLTNFLFDDDKFKKHYKTYKSIYYQKGGYTTDPSFSPIALHEYDILRRKNKLLQTNLYKKYEKYGDNITSCYINELLSIRDKRLLRVYSKLWYRLKVIVLLLSHCGVRTAAWWYMQINSKIHRYSLFTMRRWILIKWIFKRLDIKGLNVYNMHLYLENEHESHKANALAGDVLGRIPKAKPQSYTK